MSSTISRQGYNFSATSNNLVFVPEKPNLLTVKFDAETYAEFSAAAEIARVRSVSTFVHQYVVKAIEDAKKKVEPEKFQEVYNRKRAEIEERSRKKSAERKKALRAKREVIIPRKRPQKKTG